MTSDDEKALESHGPAQGHICGKCTDRAPWPDGRPQDSMTCLQSCGYSWLMRDGSTIFPEGKSSCRSKMALKNRYDWNRRDFGVSLVLESKCRPEQWKKGMLNAGSRRFWRRMWLAIAVSWKLMK